MVIFIGEDVDMDEKVRVHVQDSNFLCGYAKVGIPDENGIIWDSFWVSWDRLSKPDRESKSVNKELNDVNG
jgi:hypothetical protein